MAVPVSSLQNLRAKTRVRQHLSFAFPREQSGLDPPRKTGKAPPASPPERSEQPQDPVPRTYNESKSKSKSKSGRSSGSSGSSKPSQAKAGPRRSILITQADTRSKHEFGDTSGILSLENCYLVDLPRMVRGAGRSREHAKAARPSLRTIWRCSDSPRRPVHQLKTVGSQDVGRRAIMLFVRRKPESESEA